MPFNRKDIVKRYKNGIILVDGSRDSQHEASVEYRGNSYVFDTGAVTDYDIALEMGEGKKECKKIGRKGLVFRALSPEDNSAKTDAFQVIRNPSKIQRILQEWKNQ